MDTKQLLSELRAERDRIIQAIAAIEALDGASKRAIPHRAGARQAAAFKPARRRTMSAAARKRISEAAKRRWAERKKAAKSA
jgi:hypothetical protein